MKHPTDIDCGHSKYKDFHVCIIFIFAFSYFLHFSFRNSISFLFLLFFEHFSIFAFSIVAVLLFAFFTIHYFCRRGKIEGQGM